ncbi:hypothetical protein LXA43DRAFT_1061404 [Ganoderma leucocontextum]|nr:hypothetical protein LXA43DRAFT_1061404 [Ganoderma leucocontextum]
MMRPTIRLVPGTGAPHKLHNDVPRPPDILNANGAVVEAPCLNDPDNMEQAGPTVDPAKVRPSRLSAIPECVARVSSKRNKNNPEYEERKRFGSSAHSYRKGTCEAAPRLNEGTCFMFNRIQLRVQREERDTGHWSRAHGLNA